MTFELEAIPAGGPTDFAAAHRLVQPRLKLAQAEEESLRRWVDRGNEAVLYVSGKYNSRENSSVTFQLVVGADIVEIGSGFDAFHESTPTVSSVTLPESLNGDRPRLARLIQDALRAYRSPRGEQLFGSDPSDPDEAELFARTRWRVIAQKDSKLDLQQRAAARAKRAKQWRGKVLWQLSNALYPLGLLLGCVLLLKLNVFRGTPYLIAIAVLTVWLYFSVNSDRMQRKLSDLLAGRNKSQSYLKTLADIYEQATSRPVLPYEQLSIAIKTIDAATPEYEITFSNTGWRPVEMVFIEAGTLELVADGFASLDQDERYPYLGVWNLDEIVPALGTFRIWGKTSKAIRCRGIKGFHPATGEVDVTLANMNKGRVIDTFRVRCTSTR